MLCRRLRSSNAILNLLACLTPLVAAIIVGLTPAGAEDPRSPVGTVEIEDGDCIVFLGDSITHQRLYTQYVEDFFYTRYPKKRIVLHNAGVGGAQAWDALQRFDRDVADLRPKYVSILLGMNDGEYRPFDAEIFDKYRRDMGELLSRIKEIGATPILMTPTMFDSRVVRLKENAGWLSKPETIEFYNSVLAYYGAWLRDVALREGYGFVDMYSPLCAVTMDQRESDPRFTLVKDAIHPDPAGQVIMAVAMIEDMGLAGELSSIDIDLRSDDSAPTVSGGNLESLEFSKDRVAFEFSADALPWVLPDDAELGEQLSDLGTRCSAERLRIIGLQDGLYSLLIDDQSAGRYTSDQLAAGIMLQNNNSTPQHQQAAQVAALNKERNEGPVSELRNLWSQFQAYTQIKRASETYPNVPDLRSRLSEAGRGIADLDEAVAESIAAAKLIEDRIFAINQPTKRRYAIERRGERQ